MSRDLFELTTPSEFQGESHTSGAAGMARAAWDYLKEGHNVEKGLAIAGTVAAVCLFRSKIVRNVCSEIISGIGSKSARLGTEALAKEGTSVGTSAGLNALGEKPRIMLGVAGKALAEESALVAKPLVMNTELRVLTPASGQPLLIQPLDGAASKLSLKTMMVPELKSKVTRAVNVRGL